MAAGLWRASESRVLLTRLSTQRLTAARSNIKGGDRWKRGGLDFTGALMILVLKLIALGASRQAGTRKPREGAAAGSKLLHRCPSLFELAAYAFANGNLLGGPYFEFAEWDEFVRGEGAFGEVWSLGPGLKSWGVQGGVGSWTEGERMRMITPWR